MLSWLYQVLTSASILDWTILALCGLALLYWAGTWRHDYFARRGMPFLKPVPFLGSTSCLTFQTKSPSDFIIEKYREFEGRQAFGLLQFFVPIVVIRDPELIKMVTVKEFDHFVNHIPVATDESDIVFSRSLFSLIDQEWRDMRATLSPAFTTSKMRNMFKLIDSCGERMVNFLLHKTKSESHGAFEMEMKHFFSRFANDVIATSAFGLECDSLRQPENDFYKMGRDLTNFKGLRGFIFLMHQVFPKIMNFLKVPLVSKKVISFFHNLVHDTIGERQRKGIVRPDMLQLMMQARQGELKAEDEDETVQGGRKLKLTDTDITAQAVAFFFAGFDTTSMAMSFCAYAFAIHPDHQLRVQKEVDGVFQRLGGKLTYEGVSELKYLDAFINEVMRLYAAIPAIDRVCSKDFTIPAHEDVPEYTIRKGDQVWIPVYGLHMDPKYWTDPEKFNPDRFSDQNKHNIKPNTYMPFGVGPRICIGSRFALMEAKVALAHILHNFNIVQTAKTPKKMEYDPSELVSPSMKGGFWVGFEERKNKLMDLL